MSVRKFFESFLLLMNGICLFIYIFIYLFRSVLVVSSESYCMFSEYVKDSLAERAHISSKTSFHLSQAFTQTAIKKTKSVYKPRSLLNIQKSHLMGSFIKPLP